MWVVLLLLVNYFPLLTKQPRRSGNNTNLSAQTSRSLDSAMFMKLQNANPTLTFSFLLFVVTSRFEPVSSQCEKNGDCYNGFCPAGMCICNPGCWGSRCQFCRLRLSGDSGVITDGDGIYSSSSKCSWLIESQSPNSTIHLEFEEFATECNWDHLYIYDGKSVESPLIGVISGLVKDGANPKYADKQVDFNIEAKSGAAFLYFYSDQNYVENGFTIKYSISRDCSAKCSFHGRCDKDKNCICDTGWTGSNCNIQTCIAECVNGYCDNTTRLCVCNSGFFGSSCNVTSDRAFWVQHSSKGQDFIQGRASHSAALMGDYMWVFGGFSLNSQHFDNLIRYHISGNSWEVVSPAVDSAKGPSRRYGHSMVSYQTSLYIFGGRINQKASSELWSFDTQTLHWSLIPSKGDAPLSVSGHTATLVNSKMIVLFGYGPQRGYTDKVQEFDLESGRWSVFEVPTDLIRPSYGHSATYDSVHRLIYIHGGIYEEKRTLTELATALTSYDPITRTWKSLKGSSVPRFLHSAVFLGDVMLVFGGNSHNGTVWSHSDQQCFSTDLIAYDTACDEWKRVPYSGNIKASGRYGHSAVLVNRTMYVFGGFQGVLLNDVLSFTPGPCGLIKDKSTCQMQHHSSGCLWNDSISACLGPERCIKAEITTKEKCSEFKQSCRRCTSSLQGCSWCNGHCVKGKCPVYKDHQKKIDSPARCPKGEQDKNTCQGKCKELECFNMMSCGDCLAKHCMWCESQQQCVAFNAYRTDFPYGQCRSWVRRRCSDERCSARKTCEDCHTLPECGWCDDGSGTGLGKCMEGGDDGPFPKASNTSVNQCPVKRWYFIECPDCRCNGHSKCIGREFCEKCEHHTRGSHCQFCAVSYSGDAKNGGTCKAEENGEQCPLSQANFLPHVPPSEKDCDFSNHCTKVTCIASNGERPKLTLSVEVNSKCNEPLSATVSLKETSKLDWLITFEDGEKAMLPVLPSMLNMALPVSNASLFVHVVLKMLNGDNVNYTVELVGQLTPDGENNPVKLLLLQGTSLAVTSGDCGVISSKNAVSLIVVMIVVPVTVLVVLWLGVTLYYYRRRRQRLRLTIGYNEVSMQRLIEDDETDV